MKSIAVFCGSSTGNKAAYGDSARALAAVLIKNKLTLVYGGAKVGLMGILAQEMLKHGGHVIGIMPGFLMEKEVAHNNLTELIEVDTMHERKALIERKSDGFIAMPGGFGTVEEIFEMITWGQLKLHKKPCAFLNSAGYYNFIRSFLENAIAEGFIKKEYLEMTIIEDNPELILEKFRKYRHPVADKLYSPNKQ